jgi:hypothetical protein
LPVHLHTAGFSRGVSPAARARKASNRIPEARGPRPAPPLRARSFCLALSTPDRPRWAWPEKPTGEIQMKQQQNNRPTYAVKDFGLTYPFAEGRLVR